MSRQTNAGAASKFCWQFCAALPRHRQPIANELPVLMLCERVQYHITRGKQSLCVGVRFPFRAPWAGRRRYSILAIVARSRLRAVHLHRALEAAM